MLNLDVKEPTQKALESMAFELEDVEQAEHDAGLGNGGLGRLAACFMDSCATLKLPVIALLFHYLYCSFIMAFNISTMEVFSLPLKTCGHSVLLIIR